MPSLPVLINGSLMPGRSETPSSLFGSSSQPGATPTTGAPAIPPAIPSRQPTVASGSPESAEDAAWTTLGSPTVQPATHTSSQSQRDMVPTSSGYPSFQPWATPVSRAPAVPPTPLNIPSRTVTDSPVLAGNMTPATPGGSSSQPRATPVPVQPTFGSPHHPNVVENSTFSPMIPTESPLMLPPGTMKPTSPSPTSTPSWTPLFQMPTLTPTATPTSSDASATVRVNYRYCI